MKIPKWVDELIDKRTKYAEKLEDVSTRLDNWMMKNNIPLDPDYTEGGNMIYSEPDIAEKYVRRDILNFDNEGNNNE